MKTVVIVLALLLTSGQAWAQSCLLTSTGLPAAFYERSAAQHDAGVALAANIVPRNLQGQPDPNGAICVAMIGMSNSRRVWDRVINLTENDKRPYQAQFNQSVRLVNGAQSGKTAENWADPSDPAWAVLANELTVQGCGPGNVQAAFVKTTELVVDGPLTPADLDAIALNLAAAYPRIAVTTWSGVNYMGYAGTTKAKVQEPYANTETHLMAAHVELLPVWATLIDFWADGLTPNPYTGLSWLCTDYSSDKIHPNSAGTLKMGLHFLDTLLVDEAFAWMWNGAASATQTLTGTLALVSGECLFSSSKGTLTVPVSWCEG